MIRTALPAIAAAFLSAAAFAQTAAPKGPPPARVAFSVTSDAFPDGGEIPAKYGFRGGNTSPAFEFHWTLGPTAGSAPSSLQSYAVIFHDVENSTAKTTADTLHWTAFNIPASATGLPEGLAKGDLPDGTRNGPGLLARNGNPGGYFGPAPPPGPTHHYIFEFYALDTKLDLTAAATREDLLKAMDGHVIGKAAYTGRFQTRAQ
jgi:Raf kinase inhibitor-like YbhB/YbcL family protein